MALNQKYADLIARGDSQFQSKDYPKARTLYQEALDVKPDESYPKNQIIKIDRLIEVDKKALARQEQLNIQYQQELSQGDKFMEEGEFSVAKYHYRIARDLMPNETVPSVRLEELERRLSAQKKLEEKQEIHKPKPQFVDKRNEKLNEKYQEYLAYGEKAFNSKEWGVAKFYYRKALVIIPHGDVAKKHLSEISNMKLSIKNSKKQDAYESFINKADKAFEEEDWSVAKYYYNKAKQLNNKVDYPGEQILKIKDIILTQKNQKDDAEYSSLMEKGEKALSEKNLSVARFYFKKALLLKPNDEYVKVKLQEIHKVLKK